MFTSQPTPQMRSQPKAHYKLKAGTNPLPTAHTHVTAWKGKERDRLPHLKRILFLPCSTYGHCPRGRKTARLAARSALKMKAWKGNASSTSCGCNRHHQPWAAEGRATLGKQLRVNSSQAGEAKSALAGGSGGKEERLLHCHAPFFSRASGPAQSPSPGGAGEGFRCPSASTRTRLGPGLPFGLWADLDQP